MNLYAHALRWLLATGGLWALVSAAADAPAHPSADPGAVMAVRAWTPPDGRDDLDSARAALQPGAQVALPQGDRPEFRAEARQPIWYAVDLGPGPEGLPRVLELTHPSLRAADLYLPGNDGQPVVLRGGRDIPMAQRSGARFPATFALPLETPPGTAYLRLKSTVPTRGLFLMQPRDDWKSQSRWQFWVMTGCFAVVVCAVAYAMTRAWRLRSRAYGLYALLGLCIGMAGMFISGYGESWIWPALADWRGPIASGLACVSAGLALLLAECAFALEVRAPRFSRLLRFMGVLCPLAGVLGLAFSLSVYQSLSHVIATVATVLSLSSFWFAWHTENRAAGWLLAGFVPVSLGVSITTLAVSGIIPFEPWVLMAMPLGSVLEVPFNLYGLHRLEQRRALVLQSQAELQRVRGPAGENLQDMLRRLSGPLKGEKAVAGTGLLMLLRFPALAPGSPRLRMLDSVSVEHFLHAMMVAAVRPGHHVGRRSFHEIVLSNPLQTSDAALRSLLTALFAQALRCELHGLEPRDAALRIAYGRLEGSALSVGVALERLSAALDDPAQAGARRIEVALDGLALALSPA
jgi:hypothetical protein